MKKQRKREKKVGKKNEKTKKLIICRDGNCRVRVKYV